uniref:ferritin-like domain-containing protein n=1 Tax=Parerythrobacter lutipelagi TaxID=1964208 RepID=UPI0010F4C3B9|nr:ferritin-like domain-containing protein [Parerythrobacter lutipelagi]
MLNLIRNRYLDLLGSIYIYNEHRGYTAIDRVLEAVRARSPDDTDFIAQVEKHRADERKHYVMFKRWFELQGRKPMALDRHFGHIDRFIEIMFRRTIDKLDTDEIVARDELFERLCRVISLTEQRGYKQVEVLLDHPVVKTDPALIRIFQVIKKDEPSHWAPYDDWLRDHAKREPKWWERAVDGFIHSELLFIKLPILFLNPFVKRRENWVDEGEVDPDRYSQRIKPGTVTA